MKNTDYNFDNIYAFIREYFLSVFPYPGNKDAKEIMMAHIKAQQSTLTVTDIGSHDNIIPGLDKPIEKFIVIKSNFAALEEDIKQMITWLTKNEYLHVTTAPLQYLATDKLLSTKTLHPN